MQELVLDEEEIQAISAFADAEGQVVYFIHRLQIQGRAKNCILRYKVQTKRYN